MKENMEPAEEPKTNPEEATPVVESTSVEAEATEEVAEVVAEEAAPEVKPAEIIEEAPSKKQEAPAAPVVEAEFDWDAYEKGDALSVSAREELKNIYDNTLNAIKDKEVVEGTVISINKREVVVNVGYKSDGIVPMSEFRYNPDLKIGDKVEVYIESQEDKKGQLILS
ncbi:MAG: S1 RNA-binding domain-containing protein, partial [Paludibacter sp.]|nr:S1 RNA-binding domain-containing protein [Paludibacter sp.]